MKHLVWLAAACAMAAYAQNPPAPQRALVKSVAPEYTDQARRAGLQGSVYVSFLLQPDGSTANPELVRGLGMGLEERALKAVSQWRFEPDPAPDARPVKRSAEVVFQLDPPAPWRVEGAQFRLSTPMMTDTEVKPVLSSYTIPDPGACTAERSFATLNFTLDPAGVPASVQPGQNTDPALAVAVLPAARSWRFHPGTSDAKPRAATGAILLECRATAKPEALDGPILKFGGPVTMPVPIFRVDPEYSEEARKAKYQGDITLYLVVEPSGRPSNIRVVRSLGLGLDEKAIEAVQQWRFIPGIRDGRPVRVQANVSMSFKLL